MKLFTKTWVNDYAWLKLAIKSVLKLCTKEAVEWTIVGDQGSKQNIEIVVMGAVQECQGALKYKIYEVEEFWPECSYIQNKYLAQQWIKMNAHLVMGDDLFWNWDSDVIAVKPLSSKTFMGKSERPIYWFSQFNSLMTGADAATHQLRMGMMREIMGLPEISFEWMRGMPIAQYGQILRSGSSRIEWKRSFEMMKKGDNRFSEFNIIGQFSHLYFPDAFEWRNAETSGPTWSGGWIENGGGFQEHVSTSQAWSWGGIPPHIEAFVNAL